ncbi:16S rRNA (uracil(1498)-N(3))-methyltransferase, partial [Staphylococcus aureus]
LRGDEPLVDDPCPLDAVLSISVTHKLALAPGGAAAGATLRDLATGESIALLVGPEGGLTEDELARAEGHRWTRASIGSFVLRT